MADVIEIWADSGAVLERDFTPEELAQREVDQAEFAQAEADRITAEAEAAQNRADAIAHAKSLGFTDEMIAQMWPGLAV